MRRITEEQVVDWNVPRRSLHHAADSSWTDIWLIDRRAYARYKRKAQGGTRKKLELSRKYKHVWFGIDLANPGSDRTVEWHEKMLKDLGIDDDLVRSFVDHFHRAIGFKKTIREPALVEELRRDPVKFARYISPFSIGESGMISKWYDGIVT
jgi:hypothetical protein